MWYGWVLEWLRKRQKILLVSIGLVLLGVIVMTYVQFVSGARRTAEQSSDKRLITLHDRGSERIFLTSAKTLREAFKTQAIELDPHDTVEPSVNDELVAPQYEVNIYRARPVVIIDGAQKIKVVTPFQTPAAIAKGAALTLYPEDVTSMVRSEDFAGAGAGLQMNIDRATLIKVDLFGVPTDLRTQATTVGAFMSEKAINLDETGRVSVSLDTPITAGMQFRIWKEGRQTIATNQPINFETDYIQDADRMVGYRAVTIPGIAGSLSVTYEVDIKDGIERSRREIARVVTTPATKQTVVIGIKSLPGALTKSKGAQYFTDSKGISHRETYYDLDMKVVMQACGQGGRYSVRADGVKVDADGYAIIAANFGRYPRCSVVETSVGPAKVYDTGGFAAVHPEGFDLATDWTNYNGI